MEVREHHVEKDKVQCDRCQQQRPPITECWFPGNRHGNHTQYMDVCQPCLKELKAKEQPYADINTLVKP